MTWSKRALRSTSTITSSSTAGPSTVLPPVTFKSSPPSSQPHEAIQILPPGSSLPGLTVPELALLRKKQRQLELNAASLLTTLHPNPHSLTALSATLIFAQYEAGTAVCVDSAGWLLTCSHCIADTEEKWITPENKSKWLLYYTGLAVQVECRAWDPKRDLALLKVIAIESAPPKDIKGEIPTFMSVSLSTRPPSPRQQIVCIGQPGRDDLEVSGSKRTKYGLVEVSQGTFRGMIPGIDPHDNSQIGTLKHDAWTYWGHSGAPLLKSADGTLVGLHSSWDDETAMRHGIPHVAIADFLKQHLPNATGLSKLVSTAAGQANRSNKRKLPNGNVETSDFETG